VLGYSLSEVIAKGIRHHMHFKRSGSPKAGYYREMWAQFPPEKSEDMFIITFQLRKESRKEDELARTVLSSFFTSKRSGNGDIHCVDAKIINACKKETRSD
jgi:hypothetical protein